MTLKWKHPVDSKLITYRLTELINANGPNDARKSAWSLANDLGRELSANRLEILREFQHAVAVALQRLGKGSPPDTLIATQVETAAIQNATLQATLHVCEAYDASVSPAVGRKADKKIELLKKTRYSVLRRVSEAPSPGIRPKTIRVGLGPNVHASAVSRALRELREDGLVRLVPPTTATKSGDNRIRLYEITPRGREFLTRPSDTKRDAATTESDSEDERPCWGDIVAFIDGMMDYIPVTGKVGLLIKGFRGWGASLASEFAAAPTRWGGRIVRPIYAAVELYSAWSTLLAEIDARVRAVQADRQALPIVILDDLRFANVIQFSQLLYRRDGSSGVDLLPRRELDEDMQQVNRVLNHNLIGCGVPVIHFLGDTASDFPKAICDTPRWRSIERTGRAAEAREPTAGSPRISTPVDCAAVAGEFPPAWADIGFASPTPRPKVPLTVRRGRRTASLPA